MPAWKKVALSGSSTAFHHITASGNISTSCEATMSTGLLDLCGPLQIGPGGIMRDPAGNNVIVIGTNTVGMTAATVTNALTVGGGFGSTGTTISTTGAISTNGALTCSTGNFPFITVKGQGGVAIILGNGANFISDEGVLISKRADEDDADTDVKSTKFTKADDTEAGFIAFNESELKVKEHHLLTNMNKDLAVKRNYRIQVGGSADGDVIFDLAVDQAEVKAPLTASGIISASKGIIGELTGTASFVTSIAGAGMTAGKFVIGDVSNKTAEVNMSGDAAMNGAGAVTIQPDAVTYAKMQNLGTANRVLGSTSTGVIGEVQIVTAMIANDAVTADHIGNDVINSEHYAATSIDNEHLANNAVGTDEIADDAVTYAKMQNLGTANRVLGATSTGAIGETQVVTAMIANDAIEEEQIGAGEVKTAALADDAVDADKLAANAVVNASIAANAAIAHSKLAALASTKVLVGNGSNVATEVVLSGDVTMDNAGAVTLAAAQTNVTSLLATDIKIGEDDQTKIDFETANEIHFYANNVEQVYLGDNIFGPQTDSDVDLGADGVRWKDAYVDTITTTGDATISGDVLVGSTGKIANAGQATTHIQFNTGQMLFDCAGIEMMRMTNTSGVVFNLGGAAAADFTIEGDSDAGLFFVDSGADKISIGTVTVGNSLLTVDGDASLTHLTASTNISASGYIQSSEILGAGSGTTQLNVQGQITASGTISASGAISGPAGYRIFSKTGTTDGEGQGDICYFGTTTSMTAGAIYHWNSSGAWELADADDNTKCDGLLGVALGAASAVNGVLLRGTVTLDHDPGAVGDVIYLTTTAGDASATAPSGNGNIVRVLGYCLDASNGQIWFDPDKTFVEVTA